jgi:hypothetical protein
MFCVACGMHLRPGDATISIKGGSLDSPDLTAAFHIWTSRKLLGVVIPDGARCFEEPL